MNDTFHTAAAISHDFIAVDAEALRQEEINRQWDERELGCDERYVAVAEGFDPSGEIA